MDNGLRLYVLVSFWIGMFGFVSRLISLGVFTYPRQVKHTIGGDVGAVLLGLAFMVWAGIVLWV